MPSSPPARRHETHPSPPDRSASDCRCPAPRASSPPECFFPMAAVCSVPPPLSLPTCRLPERVTLPANSVLLLIPGPFRSLPLYFTTSLHHPSLVFTSTK